jgi:hypothetical protein
MFAKKSVQMPYNDSANNLAGQSALSGRRIAQLLTKGLWSLRRNERRVASSGLFDELWYVANNPDARALSRWGASPLCPGWRQSASRSEPLLRTRRNIRLGTPRRGQIRSSII